MKKIIFVMAVMFTAFTTSIKAQNVDAKKEFNNTLNAYFDTKNALTKDNADLASASAKNLLASIKNFPVKALILSQQTTWKTETVAINKAAIAISTAKEIKEQRKNFWALSSSMIKLAKELNMSNTAIYVQYCPMAKKSWLSEVEEVQNPFYGSMMYECGEVTETIAKK
jgi:flagella basal body P-ring formation protein FlgA